MKRSSLGAILSVLALATPALAAPSAADLIRQADAMEQIGLYEPAFELLYAGSGQFAKDVVLQYRLGQAQERKGDLWGARNAYDAALKVNPKHLPSRIGLALVYVQEDNLSAALPLLQKLVKEQPKDARLWAGLADALAGEQPQDADKAYATVLKLDPGNVAARFKRAKLASQNWEPEKAIAQLQALLADKPDYVPALVLLAQQTMANDRSQGLVLYARAFAANPGDDDVAREYLDTLTNDERYGEVEAGARRWVAARPGKNEPLAYLAGALERQKRLAEARDTVLQILANTPESVEGLLWQARLEAGLNNWPKADALYAKLIETYKDDKDLVLAYAESLTAGNRLPEATQQLRRALAMAPDSAMVHLKLAKVLIQQGQKAEAKQLLQKAAKLDPGDDEIQAELKALK